MSKRIKLSEFTPDEFVKDLDFQVLRKNAENPKQIEYSRKVVEIADFTKYHNKLIKR